MKTFEEHPLSQILPEMSGEEFNELKKDMQEHGLKQPIIIHEGKILDGRNRYRVCRELNIIPETTEYKGSDPLSYIISLNVKRRHLSASQKASVAVDFLLLLEAEAKKRMKAGGETKGKAKIPDPHQSRDQAGKIVGVSGRYVSDAKKIKETDPKIFEKVKLGEVSIPEALEVLGNVSSKEPEVVTVEELKKLAIDIKKEQTIHVYEVAIDLIKLDPNHPRTVIDKKYLDSLTLSIKSLGELINSVEIDETGMIITGGMRYRAVKKLGWRSIPARIFKTLSALDRLMRQMSENLHRIPYKDFEIGKTLYHILNWSDSLSPYEGVGRLRIEKLHKDTGLSIKDITKHLELCI